MTKQRSRVDEELTKMTDVDLLRLKSARDDAERFRYLMARCTTLLNGQKSMCVHIVGDSTDDIINVIDRGRKGWYEQTPF